MSEDARKNAKRQDSKPQRFIDPSDPFESAVDETFRKERSKPAPGLDEGKDASSDNAGPAPWGREAESLPPMGAGTSSDSRGSSLRVPRTGSARRPKPQRVPEARTDADGNPVPNDYVGDYPHSVPRWDDGPAASAPGPTPSPEPALPPDTDGSVFRRDDGRFAEDSERERGWLEPGARNAELVYWLNLGGFALQFLPFIAAIMALKNRGKVSPELAGHYTYGVRTLGLVLVYSLIASLFTDVFGLLLVPLVIWYGARNLRGLSRLQGNRPMPDPKTWTW